MINQEFTVLHHIYVSPVNTVCLQETDSLSLEMFEILENRKEMMLDIAVKCFTTASKVCIQVRLSVYVKTLWLKSEHY